MSLYKNKFSYPDTMGVMISPNNRAVKRDQRRLEASSEQFNE